MTHKRNLISSPPVISAEHAGTPASERAATTEDRVLAALVEVILEGGLPGFSVQEVANRAGVSHRTIYRHFPTREALLDGLEEAVGRFMNERGGISEPDSLEGVSAAVLTNFALFSRDARAVEASIRFGVGAAIDTRDRQRRNELFRDLVARGVPGLSPEDVAVAGTALRVIASSRAWLALREAGLDDAAAARASAWAVAVLVDALRAGRNPGAEPLPVPGNLGNHDR
jgi:AcrR family transcriptional regulator